MGMATEALPIEHPCKVKLRDHAGDIINGVLELI